jgi:hypothetical protein
LTFDISRLLSRAVHAASAILSYRFPVGKKLRSVGGIALIEVDSGKWKIEAILALKHWLDAKLPKGTVVIA